jgi:hypothetical protein
MRVVAQSRMVPRAPLGRDGAEDSKRHWRGATTSFLTHRPTGTFCYGMFTRRAPYSPEGERYRATINGPGVTPIIGWEAAALPHYDPELDRAANEVIASWGDPQCNPT